MNPARTRVFLSAGLSTPEQRARNLGLARHIEADVDLYLPQRDGGLLADLVAEGMNWSAASRLISDRDSRALRSADLVVAVLEESLVGAGVAFELGMAAAHGIPIWGLILAAKNRLRSPLIESALEEAFDSTDVLIARLGSWSRGAR